MPPGPLQTHRSLHDADALEALTLDPLRGSVGVDILRAAGAAEAGAIRSGIRPDASISDLVIPEGDGSHCLSSLLDCLS